MESAALAAVAAVVSALVTGGLSLAGVMVSNRQASDSMQAQLARQQAVTDTKIEELTREVREHNSFARRVPVLEEQMRAADRRIQSLEHGGQ